MSKIFFCKKTNGFVIEEQPGCIAVDLDHHAEFFGRPQPVGTKLSVSESGELSYVPVEYSDTDLAEFARKKRDYLLGKHVDVINAFRASELTADEMKVVSAYRKNLLDVPQQKGFPRSITWPEIPAFLK